VTELHDHLGRCGCAKLPPSTRCGACGELVGGHAWEHPHPWTFDDRHECDAFIGMVAMAEPLEDDAPDLETTAKKIRVRARRLGELAEGQKTFARMLVDVAGDVDEIVTAITKDQTEIRDLRQQIKDLAGEL
jgi:septal ring factor EnvC (AmiA/AmiB activator)